jgi:lipopolysaccharide biosynthesis glycosyltransferase
VIGNIPQFERHSRLSISKTDPIVLCAADDNYAKSLAVTLHSAASHLKPGLGLSVLLLDGGISDQSWQGLKETLVDAPINLHVMRPDQRQVGDLATSHHITHTAYFRLLAAKLLPDTIDKVIYLDADVLVRDDVNELWETEIGGDYCLAVPDIACPFVDARMANSNFRKSSPYLATLAPIRNWRALNLDPREHYFNSGVMVLNLARWRAESIEQKLLACLRENRKYVWCWDQYALNVVFAGQWSPLPLRWNQGAHAFEFPSHEHSPLDEVQFRQMRENPAIIHFTTEWKPWQYQPYHPLRQAFFDYLDNTAWRGWRPEKPAFSVGDWWNRKAVHLTKQATINYRKVSALWH